MFSRREFLKILGVSSAAVVLSPLGPLLAFADPNTVDSVNRFSKKVLVVIFQRGAMDGLSLIPPVGDPHYFENRKSTAIHKDGENPALNLDGFFAFHPSMSEMMPLWNEGSLALIHQVGSPSKSRSHFDAQDLMELGSVDQKNLPDGFLNRALTYNPLASGAGKTSSGVRAVALQPSMPKILQGAFPAISMNSVKDYHLTSTVSGSQGAAGFESMYQQATDQVLRGVGKEIFTSLDSVKNLKDSNDSIYPKSGISNHLKEIAVLIKANLSLQVAVTDMSGWDTHVGQGNQKGQLSDRFRELSGAIAAFKKDLGPLFQDVCLVTVTEFGRTVRENGNGGTDHGHGSVMMVAGGEVHGKKVYGHYKDLSKANLFEERDVPVTTDFRDVFAEIMEKHLGWREMDKIFPNFKAEPRNHLGIV
jgi:uncharacterized protein (DUF1501 family)